ncbi:MAG: GDP-mannose 4,6-dehydratase [Oscillospiraceae bacterium]|nr:GDP-mannose 4,6-dehydratase [Oscillospiraceae bacterium]
MKTLVIGAAGFVGGHLIDALSQEHAAEIFATKLPAETLSRDDCTVCDLDICDADAVLACMQTVQPDRIVHLAAQSSVALSWKNPGLTANVNIMGTLHVLDAMRQAVPGARLLLVGSGEEYGAVKPEQCPVSEAAALSPANMYAATKVCTEELARFYARSYALHIVMTRSFNHFGPGQSETFVLADFCRQASAIALGIQAPVIRTGNLSAKRDFTDVRDIVRAYLLLLEQGTPGEVYNVGSGKARAVAELLEMIRAQAETAFTVETDPARFRPVDVPLIEPDITKLMRDTGWQPRIPTEQTIADTLAFWRGKLSQE